MGIFDQWEKSVSTAKKRSTLGVNKAKGKMAESTFEGMQTMMGNTVTRTGRGHDYKVTHRHPLTGEYEGTSYHEVKSGNSKLSKLQKKTKKKIGSKYKVERLGWFF